MGENPYKKTAQLLRSYPALCLARQNLEEELSAAASLLSTYSDSAAGDDGEKINAHLYEIERRSAELTLLRTRISGIERALEALGEVDRRILRGFFMGEYTKETPFDLMDELGYEKSQLYRKRHRALAQFELHYSGKLPEG